MKRRLYFLLPDVQHTRSVVADLSDAGILSVHMHALARPDVELGDLPAANGRQKQNITGRVDRVLWNANLLLFFIALMICFALLMRGMAGWAVLPALVALGLFLAGNRYTTVLPTVHLDEFNDALQHGEILLMVDVGRKHVAEVEEIVP
ncbi:MAG: hypothetical protein JSW10_00310, partial [Pseudomonadota bacterium]